MIYFKSESCFSVNSLISDYYHDVALCSHGPSTLLRHEALSQHKLTQIMIFNYFV